MAWTCDFLAGEKVVCVESYVHPASGNVLIKGKVYTVDEVFLADFAGEGGCPFVNVLEYPVQPNGFYPWRFKRVVKRKTDISIFTRMLERQPA